MRKSITLIIIAIIATALMTSCNKESKLEEKIPAETITVFKVNTADILKDLSYDNLVEEIHKMESYKNTMDNLDDEERALLEEILNDPAASGIQFKTSLYGFFYPYEKEEQEGFMAGVIAAVKGSDFDEFLHEMDEVGGLDMEFNQHDDFQYIKYYNSAIGWNNDIAVYLGSMNHIYTESESHIMAELERLFSLEKQESLISNKDFGDFSKNAQDFNMWFALDLDADYYPYMIFDIKPFMDYTGIDDLSGNYMHMYTEIRKDGIVSSSELRVNKEVQNFKWEDMKWDKIDETIGY